VESCHWQLSFYFIPPTRPPQARCRFATAFQRRAFETAMSLLIAACGRRRAKAELSRQRGSASLRAVPARPGGGGGGWG